jgi:hypothetical protein
LKLPGDDGHGRSPLCFNCSIEGAEGKGPSFS